MIRMHSFISDLVRISRPTTSTSIIDGGRQFPAGQYDRGPKLARYAAAGHPRSGGSANLRIREVTVYADPSGSSYATATTYRPRRQHKPPRLVPTSTLAVDDFMPPADPWTRRPVVIPAPPSPV